MGVYTLTAKRGAVQCEEWFYADTDSKAAMDGAFRVMRNASDSGSEGSPPTWAKGEVVLRDPKGRTIQRMGAK